MDIQRIRNLTTGILHTEMGDIYRDIEYLTGEKGIFTHMIPNASAALGPYLREKLPDTRFWVESYDTAHTGDVEIPPMNNAERSEFWKRYIALPSPFASKNERAICSATKSALNR